MPEILESRIAPAVLTHLFQFASQADSQDLVAADSNGDIYIAGTFFGLNPPITGGDIQQVNTSDAAGDVFIGKFRPDGTALWLTSWGGPGIESVGDLVVDQNGSVYVTGAFDSTGAGFGGSGSAFTTPGSPELFVIKLNAATGVGDTGFGAGGIVQFGSTSGQAEGRSIALNGTTLFVAGSFTGSAAMINHGGVGAVTSDGRDGVLLNLNPTNGLENLGFGSGGILVQNSGSGVDDSVFRIITVSENSLYLGLHSSFPGPVTNEVFVVRKLEGNSGAVDPVFNGGSDLGITANAVDADFAIDGNERVVTGAISSGSIIFARFEQDGNLDASFGTSGVAIATVSNPQSLTVLVDSMDRTYFGGATANADYLGRFSLGGDLDGNFVPGGVEVFGNHAVEAKPSARLALDGNGYLIFRDSYRGTPDLDPTAQVEKIAPRSIITPTGMAEGFIARLDVDAIAAGQSVKLQAENPDGGPAREFIVKLSGPGRVRVVPFQLVNIEGEEIGRIELFDTTLASKLTVTGKNLLPEELIDSISTTGTNQHIGAIILSPQYLLGNADDDGLPDLLVTGRVDQLVLGDLNEHAYVKLGQDLPYNLPGNKSPDTYNNRPSLKVGSVRGDGVVIENTGDGQPQGVGGGGFGNIVFRDWAFDGVLRTTQSIGNFTIQTGDFFARLEIDKFGVGEGTTANTGMMNVQDGAWGSSGTEIEGNIEGFNANAFLAGASITAGSIGAVIIEDGDFSGLLTLTDTVADSLPTFVVETDFVGNVVSLAPLKKILVKGDFRGSLSAPSIAAITAFSFIGDAVGDGVGDADKLNITATDGLLGKIKAKSGSIRNYEFDAPNAPFSGITINLKNLVGSLVGIENVIVNAESIGPITVNLAAKTSVPGLDLTAILDSQFFATNGEVKNVNVKISGASGHSLGLDGVFFEGDKIGNVRIAVSKGKAIGATAQALDDVEISSGGSIGIVSVSGNATQAQATDWVLTGGGAIKSLKVTANTPEFGTIENGIILAGQSLNIADASSASEATALLRAASIGVVTLSGSLINSTLAVGGNTSAITLGGNLNSSFILAGAILGADRGVGGGDDEWTRAVKIAQIKIKGSFEKSVISSGIDHVNGIFGDGDDVAAASSGPLEGSGSIGAIILSEGSAVVNPAPLAFNSAILSSKIAKIIVTGQSVILDFSVPQALDVDGDGVDSDDVIIKTLLV